MHQLPRVSSVVVPKMNPSTELTDDDEDDFITVKVHSSQYKYFTLKFLTWVTWGYLPTWGYF